MGLPEKEWLNSDEVARRWKIDRDLVEHYIETGRLREFWIVHDYIGNFSWVDPKERFPPGGLKKIGLYIPMDEVRRFEDEYGLAISSAGTKTLSPTYLDPSHEHYSEELALAVNAWLALYGEGGKYRASQAHKEQIGALLPKDLSTAAIERITVLVNPKKKGGAPATGL